MHRETVFIIDDDASVRDALMLLLSLRGHVGAAFASAEDFLSALQPNWRGCLVVDIRMSGMSGLQLQAFLREQGLPLPVIIITAHGDVAAARQAFMADAVDFLEKPFDGEQLLRAVESALAGVRAVATAQVAPCAEAVAPRRAPHGTLTPTAAVLSPREHEVMGLLVQGLHNRRIAEELGISHRTVEVHKARVLDKLGVRSVVELVRLVDRKLDRSVDD
ncbi:response regulator transcription factor [Ideonella sp. A 288]|uniref:response regulator transcription factor n=1 Tax=Ideonella sp. A 288 TaxID=1962181 RepID=UPI000B4BFBEA|nr:response regulator [Ideonella sp. A 288]